MTKRRQTKRHRWWQDNTIPKRLALPMEKHEIEIELAEAEAKWNEARVNAEAWVARHAGVVDYLKQKLANIPNNEENTTGDTPPDTTDDTAVT